MGQMAKKMHMCARTDTHTPFYQRNDEKANTAEYPHQDCGETQPAHTEAGDAGWVRGADAGPSQTPRASPPLAGGCSGAAPCPGKSPLDMFIVS